MRQLSTCGGGDRGQHAVVRRLLDAVAAPGTRPRAAARARAGPPRCRGRPPWRGSRCANASTAESLARSRLGTHRGYAGRCQPGVEPGEEPRGHSRLGGHAPGDDDRVERRRIVPGLLLDELRREELPRRAVAAGREVAARVACRGRRCRRCVASAASAGRRARARRSDGRSIGSFSARMRSGASPLASSSVCSTSAADAAVGRAGEDEADLGYRAAGRPSAAG